MYTTIVSRITQEVTRALSLRGSPTTIAANLLHGPIRCMGDALFTEKLHDYYSYNHVIMVSHIYHLPVRCETMSTTFQLRTEVATLVSKD